VASTLLLADANRTIQRLLELTFAGGDVRVEAVDDGDAAIARLRDEPPDIVLADVALSGKSGYEVAAYVRQDPELSRIPVLLLTGAFEPVDQARADAAGCAGVLSKPLEPHAVAGRVKELLSAPAAERTNTVPGQTPGAIPAHDATDDLVERVAGRVLQRLSDRVMRETTAEIVSSVAERLVRAEIDRVKAAIRNL
jgi:CheY-like chemotaxis protein